VRRTAVHSAGRYSQLVAFASHFSSSLCLVSHLSVSPITFLLAAAVIVDVTGRRTGRWLEMKDSMSIVVLTQEPEVAAVDRVRLARELQRSAPRQAIDSAELLRADRDMR
jgi:hypothetical protein